jgi:hypothetical protein
LISPLGGTWLDPYMAYAGFAANSRQIPLGGTGI